MAIPTYMEAMVLEKPHTTLQYQKVKTPEPDEHEVLIKVLACGVCRTDLHILNGELTDPKLPLIPGHEIIGEIAVIGSKVTMQQIGNLVGLPWLGYTCGKCKYCLNDQENLCDNAKFTGYTLDGGYAQYVLAGEQFCFHLPDFFRDPSKAPLLCAGLIGFRSYNKTGNNVHTIGLYGFGAAAHILIQIAAHDGKEVYAFTRDNDKQSQQFALHLGAAFAGGSSQDSPKKLDAAIIFAPAGELIPQALKNVDKGGRVICGGIHMSQIPSFSYDILWEERSIHSVANMTKEDAKNFIETAAKLQIETSVTFYPLKEANKALEDLRNGKIHGAAILIMET